MSLLYVRKLVRPEAAEVANHQHHSLYAEPSSSLSTSDQPERPAALLHTPRHRIQKGNNM